ncbi:hypothetical protein [Natronorarus salvus]|uniref:hypothetical protein n=1 Tax=Natronorarus salvus TaxID=3117733 RepID=UPI002F26D1BE
MIESNDYLNAQNKDFESINSFIDYLELDYKVGDSPGDFNIIASINNLPSKSEFSQNIERNFNIVFQNDDLVLFKAKVDKEIVCHYVYLDDEFPIFFTKANKTDQIPPTIESFLQNTADVGRLQLSRRRIDQIRTELVRKYEDEIIIPFFSARRPVDASISAKRRSQFQRSIQYRASDGLETYREMKFNYGVLPKIMDFEVANQFKFRVKQDGILVLYSGSILELWERLQQEVSRAKQIKDSSNTAAYGKVGSSFYPNDGMTVSSPWGIEVKSGIKEEYLESLPTHLEEKFWEFGLSEYHPMPEIPGFTAELIDETHYERTVLKTKGNTVRVFPRKLTDIDQTVRIFNFVSDHFDSECEAQPVL